MVSFISLFLPAVLAVGIYEWTLKKKISLRHAVYLYAAQNIVINAFCFAVKKFWLGTADGSMLIDGDMTPSAALNYLIIAVPVAVIVAFICALITSTVKVTKEDDKKD
jgi:hypothetical protein